MGKAPVRRVRRQDARHARPLRHDVRGVRAGGPTPAATTARAAGWPRRSGTARGTGCTRGGPRARRHRVHPAASPGRLHRHRPDEARRLPGLLAGWASGGCTASTGRSGSGSPPATTAGTRSCCSSCRRCSTGRPASARKPGCCSRSASSAYGAALVLALPPHGYLVLALGLAGTALVRPHVTLLVFVALFIAYVLRRRSWRRRGLGLLGRIAGLGLMRADRRARAGPDGRASSTSTGSTGRRSSRCSTARRTSRRRAARSSTPDAPEVAGGVPGRRADRALPSVPVGGGQRPGTGRLGRRARC